MTRRTLAWSSLVLLLVAVARCEDYDDDATCGPQGPCASGYECVDDPYAGWECAPLACNNCPVGGGCEWDTDGNVICLYPDGGEVPEDAGTDAAAPDAESGDAESGDAESGDAESGDASTADASAIDSSATTDAALDGGAIDAAPDAGTNDASPGDGGPLDAGIDASLVSDAGSTGTDAATD